MNIPRRERISGAISEAISTATALQTILLQRREVSRRTEGKNCVRRSSHKAHSTDASPGVEGPPPFGGIGPFKGLKELPKLEMLKQTPALRELVQSSEDRGAKFERNLQLLGDSQEAKELKRAARQYHRGFESFMRDITDSAKRKIEVVLSGYEDTLSSLLPKERGFPEILKAIGSGDAARLGDAIHALTIVKQKLEVQAPMVEDESPQEDHEGFGFATAAKKIREDKRLTSVETDGSDAGAGKTPAYVEIDLAARALTIGETTVRPSDKVWAFLRELADAKRYGLPDLKPGEWKNAYDMLRRKVGKENLQLVVESTAQGYKLAENVKVKGGGQVGIRRTK